VLLLLVAPVRYHATIGVFIKKIRTSNNNTMGGATRQLRNSAVEEEQRPRKISPVDGAVARQTGAGAGGGVGSSGAGGRNDSSGGGGAIGARRPAPGFAIGSPNAGSGSPLGYAGCPLRPALSKWGYIAGLGWWRGQPSGLVRQPARHLASFRCVFCSRTLVLPPAKGWSAAPLSSNGRCLF